MFLQLQITLPEGMTGKDAGFLLHKHPDKIYTRSASFGKVHGFYPVINPQQATFMLLLEVDPVELVRGQHGIHGLDTYVNDRPYVAGSFMSVSLAKHLRSAMNGICENLPQGLEPLALEMTFGAVRCRGGESLLREFFEPLGYRLEIVRSQRHYFTLRLSHSAVTLSRALRHLYVLLPVLDQHKHYYLDRAEVDKLIEKGAGWLAEHPAYAQITRRYLGHRKGLTRMALEQLVPELEQEERVEKKPLEQELEKPLNLNQRRIQRVTETVVQLASRKSVERVVDMGCGEGKVLRALLKETRVPQVTGVDISTRELERAEKRFQRFPEHQRERAKLVQGSALYRDARFKDVDVMLLIEVIEHLELFQLPRMARVVFGELTPSHVLVSTPNKEYNAVFEMPAEQLRHHDHRFEWDRATFKDWCQQQAEAYGYRVEISGVGDVSEDYGAPTQMAVFFR